MNDLQLRSLVESAPASTKAKPKVAAPGQLLTVGQVAFRLQLHESTIIKLITTGSIPALCVRSGKRKKLFEYAKNRLKNGSLARNAKAAVRLQVKKGESKMSGLNLKQMNREAARKAKQQRKQEKRNERKQAAVDKAITGTPAQRMISPLQTQEGAMTGEPKSPPVHRAARG